MSHDFGSARLWAAALVEDALFPGARAIDATLGNGYDAKRLCELVGETGRVYGFDVQSEAVERTGARLAEAGLLERAALFCAGHEQMATHVHAPVDAIVFNLGWLPGAQHAVTTATKTTILAVNQALHLLRAGGILTICIYPGHAEGMLERTALQQWAAELPTAFDVFWKAYVNQKNNPPELLAIRKRP